MKIIQCLLTNNECYKTGKYINPIGVMVHSTGANNRTIKRYVQPSSDDPNYDELIETLGKNTYRNDWNNTTRNVCVHAFVGRLANGEVGVVQTLPWDMRGWHSGTGTKGKANDTHISFEICEDDLNDPEYFAQVYQTAVELVAYLCELKGFDPLAKGVIICHKEGHELGVASNHADVMHWFPKHGKSMDTFRNDVATLMVKHKVKAEEAEDDEWNKFNQFMSRWLEEQAKLNPSSWSKQAREYCEAKSIFSGDGYGNMRYKSFCTREELAQLIYNQAKDK